MSSEKKGNTSWRPAQMLDVKNKSEGFRYRMVNVDHANLDKKVAEGWEFVNGETGIPGEHIDPKKIVDGSKLDSTETYRDMVLMAMPEDTAQARDAYHENLTLNQTVNLKRDAKEQLDDSVRDSVDGKIIIE